MKKIINLKGWTLQKQLYLLYGIGFILILFAMICVTMGTIGKTAEEKAEATLKRDGLRIQTNFESLLERANEYSKVIMFSSGTQKLLKSENDTVRKTDMDSIYVIIGSTFVDSVYLYDFKGNEFTAATYSFMRSMSKDVTKAPWYQEVTEQSGGYQMYFNSGGFLESENKEDNYLSLIRVINNLDTQEPAGILIMNIGEKEISDIYTYVTDQYQSDFIIRDSHGRELFAVTDKSTDWKSEILTCAGTENETVTSASYGGKEYRCMNFLFSNGWTGTLVIDYESVASEYRRIIYLLAVLIFVTLIVIVTGSVYISNKINVPIRRMLDSMDKFDEKVFEPIVCKEVNKEINELQNGYNRMIRELKELFDQMAKKQKEKRQYELSILQAQIRPHFLYNTFDAISALALMKRSDDIFIIMQALGKYYRISLHKGQEVIPLYDELQIIKNYMIIMKYRFDGTFDVVYHIDSEVLSCLIPKLTLQPFVENAIFHGMKKKIHDGMIEIKVTDENGRVYIRIVDNGIGMEDEQIRKILQGSVKSEEKGFGVCSTIERLKLYYNEEDVVSVESEPGKGTIVTIRIPETE